MLQQAYGEDCLSRRQCHEWYQRFKSGRTSIVGRGVSRVDGGTLKETSLIKL